jgi:hypothetical protein
MLKLAAQMDRIAQQAQNATKVAVDHFFAGLATWAGNTLRFMSQKPGVPLTQASKAIAAYLTNDYRANDQKLRAAAVQAVNQLQNDPARFLGEILPNLLPLPKVKMLEQIAQVEKSVERISQVAKIEETFAGEFNSNALKSSETAPVPQFGAASTPQPFADNACVSTAVGQDALWAADETFQIQGVEILNGKTDLVMTGAEVQELLKARYGDIIRRNPNFTPQERLLFRLGTPMPVKPGDIERILGPWDGSRGLVFIRPVKGIGHAFNVRNLKGFIQYLDASQKMDGRLWFNLPLKDVFFFPTN